MNKKMMTSILINITPITLAAICNDILDVPEWERRAEDDIVFEAALNLGCNILGREEFTQMLDTDE